MFFFGLQGVSLIKLIVTGLLWISFVIALIEFAGRYGLVKKILARNGFILFGTLLVWNILCIAKSLIFRDDTITTILGNATTSLALLVPFVLVFAIRKSNLHYLHKYFLILLLFGIGLSPLFYVATGGDFNDFTLLTLSLLLSPVVFLITQFPYLTKKNRFIVIIGAAILFLVAYRSGVRTMIIREFLLFGCLFAILLYHKFRYKWVLYMAFPGLLVPLLLIGQGMATGISPFEEYLTFSDDDELSTDTRTFLYIELYSDLVENNRLLIGKGATGKYYSDYFSLAEGDASLRINMEVGILGVLMKGGLIAMTLNLAVFFIAIFYAFFRSKNSYVVGIGFILYVHTILLFIQNVIVYSTYNYLIWICVGICLSKDMRLLNNSQIKAILRKGRL